MRKIVFFFFSFCVLAGCFVSINGCILKPYHVDIQQGNILEQKEIDKIHLGMTRKEVQSMLGTPMLRNTFDDNCWTYVYTMQKNGGKIQGQELALRFSGNKLTSIDKIQMHAIK